MKNYKLLISILFIGVAHSLFAQQHPTGMLFNDQAYAREPQKAMLTRGLMDTLPPKASLKMYAPYPKSQDVYQTCVAWSSAYCGRTIVDAIKNNWTDRNFITQNAYSPAFLFRLIKPDGSCNAGSYIDYAFAAMKTRGSLPYTNLPALCTPTINDAELTMAASAKLKDYATLFQSNSAANFKIQATKKALSEKKPVVIGMLVPMSFQTAVNCWQPYEEPASTHDGHAMCVIGYDDAQYGGAFEIQNSWGIGWGNGGYMWIKYADYARFVQYAFEFVDLPEVKADVPDLAGSVKLMLATGEQMPVNLLVSTRGLKVVSANTTPQPLTIYKTAKAYASGTNFRIYISNNEPAYVYAISSDLTNAVTKIFPYADNISAVLDYKKNEVPIPDELHYIQFDNQPGTDFLCVLYSRKELNINDVVSKITAATGTFNERVYNVLGDQVADPKNISFSSGDISFKGNSDNKNVVALMVELDHK